MKNHYLAHRSADGTEVQLLTEHLEGVAVRAREFASAFDAGDLAYACGSVHDIGKYSDEFQRRINGANISVDHSTAGAQLVCSLDTGYLGTLVAYCVMGHHAGLPDGGSENMPGQPTLYSRLEKSLPSYDAYKSECTIPPLTPPGFQPEDDNGGFQIAFLIRMLFSSLVDADWLDTEFFMQAGSVKRGGFCDLDELKQRLDEKLSKFQNPNNELNAKRTAILNDCLRTAQNERGLFTLTAPTGSGKTLSSVAFAINHALANRQQRVIYVVPYNTIIEQNAKVFEDIFGAENVLQHHNGISYDVSENASESDYRKLLATENWDAPIIVTSSVRFFESLFRNKPSDCRKLHNIANSVVVFDEAQMIPLAHLLPCVAVIKELVAHYNCSAVLATATQSSLDEYFAPTVLQEITKNPQDLYEYFRRVIFEVRAQPLSLDGLIEQLESHEQVLCIVNTRKRAQELVEALSGDVFHLSTTMYPLHRSRILNEIQQRLKSGVPCRVVSTSVIEAGVDIDFPAAYREKAGLDSIVQAAGRCNREGRRKKEESVVRIFAMEDALLGYIDWNIAAYEHAARTYQDIASLDAIREYFERLRYIIGEEGLDKNSVIQEFNTGLGSASFPFKTISQMFHLIEDNTRSLIVSDGDEAEALICRLRFGERTRGLFRAVQRYSVSLYENDWRKLHEMGVIEVIDEEVMVLAKQYYDVRYGVPLAPKGGIGLFS
ncbi:MAG: CRISPR-associated helicase Cas3' [Coriobacteriales bacterium]|jgi:CRISPR-associated endonuclease/helicase Cas3|nr:CRISPR-associated helicase Cas3' [Coriobacteriales bacterium]